MSYLEKQDRWVKDNDIHVGDFVKVVCDAEDYENGWDTVWTPTMDEFVGHEFEVSKIDGDLGIFLCSDDFDYWFPYFCLEPITQSETIEPPRDNEILREGDQEELELIEGEYYAVTICKSKSEWVYRRKNGENQTSHNGCFSLTGGHFDGSPNNVCDEYDIESIRKATVEEANRLKEKLGILEPSQELINDEIYHATCKRDGDSPSEWIYRYCDKRFGRGGCNGSYEIFGSDPKYWEGDGLIADEDEIESIRKATEDEKEVFLKEEDLFFRKQRLMGEDMEESEIADEIELFVDYTQPKNKYSREIYPDVWVDVYDVLRAFDVTDGALAHLVKKALADGQRGHKDQMQDRIDIRDSAECAIRNLEIEEKIKERE